MAKIPNALIEQLDVEYSMEPVQFVRFALKALRALAKDPDVGVILKGIKQKAKKRARDRQLSMAEFIRFCVEKELQRPYTKLHKVALRLHDDWYGRLKQVSGNEPSRWVRTVVFEELKSAGFDELEPLNDLRTFNNGVGQTRESMSEGGYILRIALPADYRSAIQRLYGEQNVSYVIKRWLQTRIDTDPEEPLTPLRGRKAVDGIWPRVKTSSRQVAPLIGRQSRRLDFS